jgi:hypothetical protein
MSELSSPPITLAVLGLRNLSLSVYLMYILEYVRVCPHALYVCVNQLQHT